MEHLTDSRKATNWCVYWHEHRENGKRYIGITSLKPTNRWANGDGYKRCPLFYAAIQKYGWDAFRHEVLYTGLTQEEAERLEVELIAKYQTQDHEKGYNLAAGGGVNHGFHRTEEFKQKLSEARTGVYAGERHNMYGKPKSEETKEKIRSAQVGVPKTPEMRSNMSAAAKRRWSSENRAEREYLRELNKGVNSAKARAVLCVETGVVYDYVRGASEQTGIELSSIIRCCKGQRHTAGGYHWRYADEAVTVDG